MDQAVCGRCKVSKPTTEFHADRSKPTGHTTICKTCVSERQRAMRAAMTDGQRQAYRDYQRTYHRTIADKRRAFYQACRARGIAEYGGACACCGERRPEFLTFDHVGEWGSQHRSSDSGATSIVLWLHRNNYPQDGSIQLLCWNCNCARGTYGYCPHSREVDPVLSGYTPGGRVDEVEPL